MTTPTLPFRTVSDQTRSRWAKLLDSARRDLTPRMRCLIRIILDACDSTAPTRMQATTWDSGESIWLLCHQADLAKLLDCSDRTLRTEFERLTDLQALKKLPHKSIPNMIAYRFDLCVLESLPESLTPELDEIIFDYMESLAESSEAASVSVSGQISAPISVSVSGQISGPVSGPLSGGLSGPVSAPMVMTMKQEHENKHHGHDHGVLESSVAESQTQAAKSVRVKFKNIQPADVTRIVHRGDAELFQKFFEDLVERRWAKNCDSDRVRLAATFHYVSRQDTQTPGKLATWAWKNRDGKKSDKSPVVPLTESDEDFARKLLRPKPAGRSETPVTIVNPLRQMDDRGFGDLSAEEIDRQTLFRANQRRVLAAMQR